MLSINDVSFSEIKVLPNPFNDSIIIDLASLSVNELKIEIFDINGRSVFSNTYSEIYGEINIDSLGKLENGHYFLRMSNKELALEVNKKLVKY